jgi:Domain of Unknown Function (DUF1543)
MEPMDPLESKGQVKLFLVHCGFYDPEVGDGVYESHVNFFVVAEDFAEARMRVKKNPIFLNKRMHIDGLQQVEAIDGYRVNLDLDKELDGRSQVLSHRYNELLPKKSPKGVPIH